MPRLVHSEALNVAPLRSLVVGCASVPSRVEAMLCNEDQDSHNPKPEDAMLCPRLFLRETQPVLATDPASAAVEGGLEGCAPGIGDAPRDVEGDLDFD